MPSNPYKEQQRAFEFIDKVMKAVEDGHGVIVANLIYDVTLHYAVSKKLVEERIRHAVGHYNFLFEDGIIKKKEVAEDEEKKSLLNT